MIRIILAVVALAAAMPRLASAENPASANRKGIEAYERGDFEASAEHFTDAIVQDPESDVIRFNRGTALSAAGNQEEAVSELSRSATESGDKTLAAGAYFNAGNTLLRASELDAAIDQYKKALKLDQDSPDIRHNLELAVRLRDQQKQQQQQEQEQNDQQNQNEDEHQQDDQQQQQQQEQEQNEKNRQQSDQEGSDATPDDSRLDTPMSIEEAERILDAIENEERQALAAKNKQMNAGVTDGNDW